MKLYMHPVSTVCRPIRLMLAENNIQIDEETVDLMTGAHHSETYVSLNPNCQVPLLVDGDLRLTEGSAILKYLAEKYHLPSIPPATSRRAPRSTRRWTGSTPASIATSAITSSIRSCSHITSAAATRPMPARSPGAREGVEEMAVPAQRSLDRAGQPLPGRRQPDHRRLFRLRPGHYRRSDRLRHGPYPNICRWLGK